MASNNDIIIALPVIIRNKYLGIGVSLTSKSSWLVKPSVVLVLVFVAIFEETDMIGFTFAPYWFVKTG